MSFLKVISKTCKGLKESEVLHFSRHISSAVEYLHSQRIVHRDLKPENIVLKEVDGRVSIQHCCFLLVYSYCKNKILAIFK